MGLYLNPGNEAFRQAVTDDIYIDKLNVDCSHKPEDQSIKSKIYLRKPPPPFWKVYGSGYACCLLWEGL